MHKTNYYSTLATPAAGLPALARRYLLRLGRRTLLKYTMEGKLKTRLQWASFIVLLNDPTFVGLRSLGQEPFDSKTWNKPKESQHLGTFFVSKG